jgi:hypothetical protein
LGCDPSTAGDRAFWRSDRLRNALRRATRSDRGALLQLPSLATPEGNSTMALDDVFLAFPRGMA